MPHVLEGVIPVSFELSSSSRIAAASSESPLIPMLRSNGGLRQRVRFHESGGNGACYSTAESKDSTDIFTATDGVPA